MFWMLKKYQGKKNSHDYLVELVENSPNIFKGVCFFGGGLGFFGCGRKYPPHFFVWEESKVQVIVGDLPGQ